MSNQSSSLSAQPVATSNLVAFPNPSASVPLSNMAPAAAEKIIREALATAFLSHPGTIKEIRLLDHVELRLARVDKGVDIEINDTSMIEQIWQKKYTSLAWAIRGLAAKLVESELGLVLPNVPRRQNSRSKGEAASELRPVTGDDGVHAGVWKKRIPPDTWNASFGEGRGRVEATVVVDSDGADATLNWRDAIFESSFEGEWEAKSATLKLVHELPGWRLVLPQSSNASPASEA